MHVSLMAITRTAKHELGSQSRAKGYGVFIFPTVWQKFSNLLACVTVE